MGKSILSFYQYALFGYLERNKRSFGVGSKNKLELYFVSLQLFGIKVGGVGAGRML